MKKLIHSTLLLILTSCFVTACSSNADTTSIEISNESGNESSNVSVENQGSESKESNVTSSQSLDLTLRSLLKDRYNFEQQEIDEMSLEEVARVIQSKAENDPPENYDQLKAEINRLLAVQNTTEDKADGQIIDSEVTVDLRKAFTSQTVDIHYKLKVHPGMAITASPLWESELDYVYSVLPFVTNDTDSFRLNSDKRSIDYVFESDGYTTVGYTLQLDKGQMPVGVILDDMGYLGIRNIIDDRLITSDSCVLRILAPEGTEVHTPYEPIDDTLETKWDYSSDKADIYVIQGIRPGGGSQAIHKGGNIIFGTFDSASTYDYGDHQLLMLTKGIPSDHESVKITTTTYGHILNKVMGDQQDLFTPKATILYANSNEHTFRAEGFRGSQIEVLDPFKKTEVIRVPNASYEYFTNYPSLKGAGRLYVHQIIHATFDDEFSGWWSVEGLAEYYMGPMLLASDIIDSKTLNQIEVDLVDFYLNEIAENDMPLHLNYKSDKTQTELESKYPIEIHDYQQGPMNPGDHYKWTVDKEKTYWFPYVKGALVFMYIDKYVTQHTDNDVNLDDILNLYLTKRDDVSDRYTAFELSVEELSGNDFQGFFDKYVMDNTLLPLEIVDNKVKAGDW